MTILIVGILLIGLILIATEPFTNINKAAVAIFVCSLGWVLYICFGSEYVTGVSSSEFQTFIDGSLSNSRAVKEYISHGVFLKYVGKASEVVLFLLATMTIVEILQNNGCFDFITRILRTRDSRRMIWILSGVTFVLSANLDNLTSTVMILTILHGLIRPRRQRMLLGSAVVISANCGGALTVIGDPLGIVLWNDGVVTATNYSMSLALPCLAAWALPVWLIGKKLPARLDTQWTTMPYRGDDTNLNVWQRLLMLFVGIGGLWFIPTFHNITRLSPFIGALCVLSVLWVVNEIVNRKLANTDEMIHRRVPRVLQYGVIQMILFVLGIMLSLGVVSETGVIGSLSESLHNHIDSVWLIGIAVGAISTILENFTSAMSMITIMDTDFARSAIDPIYIQNGVCWKIAAYAAAVGGNILCWGSMSGLALMKMEHIKIGWYFRNVGWKNIIGFIAGFLILYLSVQMSVW